MRRSSWHFVPTLASLAGTSAGGRRPQQLGVRLTSNGAGLRRLTNHPGRANVMPLLEYQIVCDAERRMCPVAAIHHPLCHVDARSMTLVRPPTSAASLTGPL